MEALLGEATLGRWARAMETCFGVIVVPAPAVKHRHEAEADSVVNRGIIQQGSRSGSVSQSAVRPGTAEGICCRNDATHLPSR